MYLHSWNAPADSPPFASSVSPASLSSKQNFRRGYKFMKVCNSLKLNQNLASTLPGVRPLGILALFLCVSSFPAQAFPLQETTTPRTFADWCLNRPKLSIQIQITVSALLQVAKT